MHSLHFSLLLFLSFLVITSSHSSDLCSQLISALQAKDQSLVQKLIDQAETIPTQSCFLDLVPKYYWAQNMSHLMLKIQFLNSADTSACGKVISVRKKVTHQQIEVKLICTMGSLILRYSLSLKTYMPLNYYQAIWKQGHQNTIYLECMKSPNPFFWKRLYLENYVPARKPRIWWKMLQKYKDDLSKYINDLEVEEEEQDISFLVRKRKKVRKSPFWNLYQPESSIYFYCNQNNPFQLGSWMI